MVRQITERFGPIDVLVNNTGSLIERSRFLDIAEERWDEVMDVNL
jgi:NAD(P)-dependent dehydrogenase (short-subunit alcohol dehydrogenase family)